MKKFVKFVQWFLIDGLFFLLVLSATVKGNATAAACVFWLTVIFTPLGLFMLWSMPRVRVRHRRHHAARYLRVHVHIRDLRLPHPDPQHGAPENQRSPQAPSRRGIIVISVDFFLKPRIIHILKRTTGEANDTLHR